MVTIGALNFVGQLFLEVAVIINSRQAIRERQIGQIFIASSQPVKFFF
jgi:hypothetical protein